MDAAERVKVGSLLARIFCTVRGTVNRAFQRAESPLPSRKRVSSVAQCRDKELSPCTHGERRAPCAVPPHLYDECQSCAGLRKGGDIMTRTHTFENPHRVVLGREGGSKQRDSTVPGASKATSVELPQNVWKQVKHHQQQQKKRTRDICVFSHDMIYEHKGGDGNIVP